MLAMVSRQVKWWQTRAPVTRGWWADAVRYVGSGNSEVVRTIITKAAKDVEPIAARGLPERTRSTLTFTMGKRARSGTRGCL